MITPEWCQMMACYNAWQNKNLLGAADTLTDEARHADRGAFFGSIQGTLSHILWGDLVWMTRLFGWAPPEGEASNSSHFLPDWGEYKTTRFDTDKRIVGLADSLEPKDLEGDFTWYYKGTECDVTRPRALLIAHIFNHQTHHRGQVHAMLTAAGTKPGATDIPFMPDTI